MATKKISELDAISSIESNDLFVVVDTSEGETNKITKENALSGLQPTITSENKISSDYVDDTGADNLFVSSNDIATWNSKLSSESDPIFTASPAYGIASGDITNWNGKQDTLTAGTGISISNNVISSTVDGGTKLYEIRYDNINTSTEKNKLKEIAEDYENNKDIIVLILGGSGYYFTPSIANVDKSGSRYVISFDYIKDTPASMTGIYGIYYKHCIKVFLPYTVNGSTVTIGTIETQEYYMLDTKTRSQLPLASGNTESYTPSGNYNPATKKYVDDSIGGISIPTKTSDLTNDSGFITTETDPVFTASDAYGISSSDISNWNGKQAKLVSGTNIKTINGNSLLGSGDLVISGGGSDFTEITSSVTTYGSIFTEGESKWYKITTGSLSINLNPSGSKTFSAGSLVLCSKYLTTDGYIAFTIIDDTGIYNYEYLGSSVSSRSKFDDKSPLSQETLGNSIKILDSIPSSTNWAILFEAPITIVTKDITIEYQDTSTSLTETFMFPANTIIVGTLNGLMVRNSPIIIYLSDGQKYQVANATVASLHIDLLEDTILTILETNSYMEHKTNDNLPFMSPYKVDKELVACLPLYYQGQTSIDVISLNDILNHYTTPFINIPRDYNDSQIVDNTVDPNVFADPNYIGITPSNDGITFNNQNSENFFIEINYADVLGNNSVVNTGMMRGDLDINASLTFMSQMALSFDTTLKSRMFDYIGGGTRETYEGIANHWEVNNYITPGEVYIGPDEMTFDITLSSNYNDINTLNTYQNNAYLKVLNFGNSLEPGEFERRCYIKIWRIK